MSKRRTGALVHWFTGTLVHDEPTVSCFTRHPLTPPHRGREEEAVRDYGITSALVHMGKQ
jgi:hypothetical protein